MSADRYFYGLGKRKEAVVKVFLTAGSGKMVVELGNRDNRMVKGVDEYFCDRFLVQDMITPIKLVNKLDEFDVRIHVRGGGIRAQAAASKLGIARALVENNAGFKLVFKSYKLLTQDNRYKERKKVGKRGARRSPQFTKR